MNQDSPDNPWRITPLTLGGEIQPTWAEHNNGRPYSSVMEMGAALNHDYPHFLAVLSPERLFLHYLISKLICNVSIKDKDTLQHQVNRLFDENKAKVRAIYEELGPELEEQKELYRQFIAEFFKEKTVEPRTEDYDYLNTTLPKRTDAILAKYKKRHNIPHDTHIDHMGHRLVKAILEQKKHLPPASAEEQEAEEYVRRLLELRNRCENIYHAIHDQMSHRETHYVPGQIDSKNLNNFEKVFTACCMDAFEQKQHETIAEFVAEGVIAKEVEANRLKLLPTHEKSKARNVILAGVHASGKNLMLKEWEASGRVNREEWAVVDIDEFRDLDRIVEKDLDNQKPHWGTRAHDECHMIRRKIMDELEKKAGRGRLPNVLLMTAHLSPRWLEWLTQDNPRTKIICPYSRPEKALQNAFERSKKEGRWVPTETVLDSYANLAMTLRFFLGTHIGKNSKLSLKLCDTSDMMIEDEPGPRGLIPRTKNIKDLLILDKKGLQIFDLKECMRVLKGRHINIKADAPDSPTNPLYLPPDCESQVRKDMRTLLGPHDVKFMGREGKYVEKPAGSDAPNPPPADNHGLTLLYENIIDRLYKHRAGPSRGAH